MLHGSQNLALHLSRNRFTLNIDSIDEALFSDLGLRFVDTDNFGSELVWKSSISYLIPETDIRLKANYGTAYNAPNVYYYLNRATDKLAPEQSRGFDLGFEQQLTLDNDYGTASLTSKMILKINLLWSGLNVINISKTRAKGIESFLQYAITDTLSVNLNYTWLDTEDKTTKKTLDFSHQHCAHASLSYQLEDRLGTHLSIDYVSGQYNTSWPPNNEDSLTGGYALCNLAGVLIL